MNEKQILYGVGKAISKYPEWWGKKTLEWYDQIRFPKYTKEEKKVQDKMHNFLKKNYKAVGWTETGIQAALLTTVVVKGLKKLRKPPELATSMPSFPVEAPPARSETVYLWSDGEQQILESMQLHNKDKKTYSGIEEQAAHVLARACVEFDNQSVLNRPHSVTRKAGAIGAYLMAPGHLGKMKALDEFGSPPTYEYAMPTLPKLLDELQLEFVQWFNAKVNPGMDGKWLFEYWVDTLRCAGVEFLLPNEDPGYPHRFASAKNVPVIMSGITQAFKKNGWVFDG